MQSSQDEFPVYLPILLASMEILCLSSGKNLIDGKDFARTVLAIWLGPNPPNEGLKQGLE